MWGPSSNSPCKHPPSSRIHHYAVRCSSLLAPPSHKVTVAAAGTGAVGSATAVKLAVDEAAADLEARSEASVAAVETAALEGSVADAKGAGA